MTAASVRGCRRSGPRLRHSATSPGSGPPRAAPPTVPPPWAWTPPPLDVRDLAPFRAAIAEKVPAIVVSLALYAAYDPVTPGALSPAIVSGLLRDQLGFKGVAISDDLSAGGPASGLPAPDAAVQALAAGIDLVVVSDPGRGGEGAEAILQAARSGAIPPPA